MRRFVGFIVEEVPFVVVVVAGSGVAEVEEVEEVAGCRA